MKQVDALQQSLNTLDVSFDSATRERIHQHLSDINDVITEQDIKNVKTDNTLIEAAIHQEQLRHY